MKQSCTYHPTQKAHWHCAKCGAALCPECVVARDKSGFGGVTGKVHLCPKCHVPVDWTGAANLIEPFWQQLPRFFVYPLKVEPLIANVMLSVLALLFGWVPYINMILSALLIKYAFTILKRTVYGDMRPPRLDMIADLNDITPVAKQWILFVLLWVGGTIILGSVGTAGALIYAILVILLLPAMIILLVTSEQMTHALNPVVLTGMVVRMGGGYFLMWLFLALLLFAPGSLVYLLSKFMHPYVLTPLVNLIKNYYTFVSYFLMGYVILQYHEQLNYEISFEDFYDPSTEKNKKTGETADPQQDILQQVEILTKDGKIDEAVNYIKEATATAGFLSIVLLERFYKLLSIKKDIPEMLAAGETLIGRLIQEGRKEDACDTYVTCAAQKGRLQMAAADLVRVGGWLQEQGKPKAAANAYTRMIKLHPEDALAPKAYFQLAQLYNEKLNNAAKSKKLIETLINKYPDHDIVRYAERYQAGIAV